MARPVEFDLDVARDAALKLFWRKGYQASSLTDLLAVMRIGRSSFYAAFGDKRSLFISCLDLFAQRNQEIVGRARAALPPLEALQGFIELDFVGPRRAREPWGCMLVNTVLEMAGVDDELAARASNHLADMQMIFEDCLKDAGCPPSRAADLAGMLMVVNEGVRVSSRRRMPTDAQLQPIRTSFSLIRSVIG